MRTFVCLVLVAGGADLVTGARLRHTTRPPHTAAVAASPTAPSSNSAASLLEAAAAKVASTATSRVRAGGEAGGEAGKAGKAGMTPPWNPWGAAYPSAMQPPYGPFPQPHPYAHMMSQGGIYAGMVPPMNMYPHAGSVTNPYTGMQVPAPGVNPAMMMGGPGGISNPMSPMSPMSPVIAHSMYGPMGIGNVSYHNLYGFPGSMMHPYGPMIAPGLPGFPDMSSSNSSMYSSFNPYAMSAYHPLTHYNMGFYHGALSTGQGIVNDEGNRQSEVPYGDKDYHVAMPPPLPSIAAAPGSGRGVNVAVHDATLVPVPISTGRSPAAIAQEVAREREERGQHSPWSPYNGAFNNPMAFSETGHGMLHTTMAGDGFMAPPLKNYEGSTQVMNGAGVGSSMYPVQLPNGMTMNVPADEISSYPNVMPSMVAGPLSGQNVMGHGLSGIMSEPDEQLGLGGANPWNSRLAGTEAQITQQQAFFNQYAMAGAQHMMGTQRQTQALTARLAALQASLDQSKRQAEQQKKYLDQVARRSAALEVDKHRVQAEAQLAAVTMQYQQVRNHDEQLRQAQLKVDAAKEGLLKQAYAFRSVVRSDTDAIKKLVDPGAGKSGSEAGGEAGGEGGEGGEKAKIEKEEKKVVDMQVQAAADKEKAASKGAKAADAAVKQLESDPNMFVKSGGEAGSEAGGEAKR